MTSIGSNRSVSPIQPYLETLPEDQSRQSKKSPPCSLSMEISLMVSCNDINVARHSSSSSQFSKPPCLAFNRTSTTIPSVGGKKVFTSRLACFREATNVRNFPERVSEVLFTSWKKSTERHYQ